MNDLRIRKLSAVLFAFAALGIITTIGKAQQTTTTTHHHVAGPVARRPREIRGNRFEHPAGRRRAGHSGRGRRQPGYRRLRRLLRHAGHSAQGCAEHQRHRPGERPDLDRNELRRRLREPEGPPDTRAG